MRRRKGQNAAGAYVEIQTPLGPRFQWFTHEQIKGGAVERAEGRKDAPKKAAPRPPDHLRRAFEPKGKPEAEPKAQPKAGSRYSYDTASKSLGKYAKGATPEQKQLLNSLIWISQTDAKGNRISPIEGQGNTELFKLSGDDAKRILRLVRKGDWVAIEAEVSDFRAKREASMGTDLGRAQAEGITRQRELGQGFLKPGDNGGQRVYDEPLPATPVERMRMELGRNLGEFGQGLADFTRPALTAIPGVGTVADAVARGTTAGLQSIAGIPGLAQVTQMPMIGTPEFVQGIAQTARGKGARPGDYAADTLGQGVIGAAAAVPQGLADLLGALDTDNPGLNPAERARRLGSFGLNYVGALAGANSMTRLNTGAVDDLARVAAPKASPIHQMTPDQMRQMADMLDEDAPNLPDQEMFGAMARARQLRAEADRLDADAVGQTGDLPGAAFRESQRSPGPTERGEQFNTPDPEIQEAFGLQPRQRLTLSDFEGRVTPEADVPLTREQKVARARAENDARRAELRAKTRTPGMRSKQQGAVVRLTADDFELLARDAYDLVLAGTHTLARAIDTLEARFNPKEREELFRQIKAIDREGLLDEADYQAARIVEEPTSDEAIRQMSEQGTTGARSRLIEYERARRGAPELSRQAYTQLNQAYETGRQAVESGYDVRGVAASVAKEPRPLTTQEVGALAFDRQRLLQERQAALNAGDPDRFAIAEALLDDNDKALVLGGREQSAAFNARRVLVRKDYTLESLEGEFRLAWRKNHPRGEPVPQAYLDKLSQQSRRIAELEEALASKQATRPETGPARAATQPASAKARAARADAARQRIADRVEAIKRRAAEAAGGGPMNAAAVLDPEFAKDVAAIVRDYMELGYLKVEDAVDQAVKVLTDNGVEIDHRQARDAFSGYGQESPSEVRKSYNSAKRAAWLMSAIEDALEGKPLPASRARSKPSELIVELRAQLKDAIGDGPRLERLQGTLDRLEARIRSGEGPEPAKPRPEDSPEVQEVKGQIGQARRELELQATQKRLRERARKGLGPEPRNRKLDPPEVAEAKAEIADLRKQLDLQGRIADLEEQIATATFKRAERVEKEWSNEVQILQRRLDGLRAQADQMILMADPQSYIAKASIAIRAMRLLNPVARVKDLVGNTAVFAARMAEQGLTPLADRVLFPTLNKEQGAAFSGWSLQRAREVGRGARKRWMSEIRRQVTEGDPDFLRKFGHSELRGAQSRVGQAVQGAVNTVNRIAGTTDIPFKDTYYRSVLWDLSYAKAQHALGRGASKADVWSKAEEIVADAMAGNDHGDLVQVATEESMEFVFAGDNVGAQLVDRLRRKEGGMSQGSELVHALLDVAIQFPRIFTEIARYATDHAYGGLKAGMALTDARRTMSKQGIDVLPLKTRRRISQLMVRQGLGAATFAIGGYLASRGFQPLAIRDDGSAREPEWTELPGPLAVLMAGAALGQIEHHNDGRTPDPRKDPYYLTPNQVEKLKWGVALQLIDQPLVTGTGNLASVLSGDRPGSKYAANTLRSVVIPGVVRDTARRMDTQGGVFQGTEPERVEKDLGDALRAGIPGLRQQLPTKEEVEARERLYKRLGIEL